MRRSEGGAKIFGVFRVKNHDFTPKNHIFSDFRGGARAGCPPPESALAIITNIVSPNPVHGEVYSIQYHVIKFVSDLRQLGGFLRVLRFPPQIKLTATI